MSTLAVFDGGLVDIMALLSQQFALPGMSECYELCDGMLGCPAGYGRNPGVLCGASSVDVKEGYGQANKGCKD